MSWRGVEKRVKSPTSVTSTTALISAIPRIACKASTTTGAVPFGEEAEYLFFDSLQAPFRIHDGIDIVLKCDLLDSGMFEGQSR